MATLEPVLTQTFNSDLVCQALNEIAQESSKNKKLENGEPLHKQSFI